VNTQDSFRNPFSDYNANGMDTQKILEYWCNPFSFFKAPISEQDIYQHNMPIVFMGGRGSGKTMFLKYFSYQVQCEAAKKTHGGGYNNLLSFLKAKGGIGVYLQIDGPVLHSFSGKGLQDEKWDAIFTHYFELQVCKSYIEVILHLINNEQISRQCVDNEFVPAMAKKLGLPEKSGNQIEDIINIIEDLIQEVNSFRENVAFSDTEFKPSKPFVAQDLSFGVINLIRETITDLKSGLTFVILIDEYENYNQRQQVILNTLLKSVKPGIAFRLGMRLKGFHTYDTISPQEFLKEGRDYTKFVFEDIIIKDRNYRQFLKSVAAKRLETIPSFKKSNFLDISKFLGNRENLENEARELVKDERKPKHFDLLKRAELFNKQFDENEIKYIEELISKPENPLLELLNILWIMRGNDPQTTKDAMNEYLSGNRSSASANKYYLDYVDKYKLSLMIILASQYHKSKMYYSFNTFCFLSSGIVGSFIELCRRSFQYAYFNERNKLMNEGVISNELQDRAARDYAVAELEMANRIQDYGHNIYLFARNLLNIFEGYQKDLRLRYPETNQFTVDSSIYEDPKLEGMFNTAIRWSVIQQKTHLQKQTPGALKTDIFTLNRVFSPICDLSYRTRGGYSEKLDALYLRELMTQDKPKSRLGLKRRAPKQKNETKEGFQERLI
jgi:hypothetical protein